MDDVQRNLDAAWNRIRPHLLQNPRELARRLARLDRALLQSPPRAWCIALRATDTRLDPFATSRPRASSPEHDIALTGREIARLVAPVYLPRGGLRLDDVARRLGTTPQNLLDARLNRVFTARHVAGLGGAGGKPRPLLSCDRPLDPCARSFALADPIWSATAPHHPGRIPGSLRVTLTRVPHFHSRQPRDLERDTRDLHPEHPLVDPPPPKHRAQRLPPPERDYVWYKWKGDEYVGYDWRAENPLITGHHMKHARELEKTRETRRQRRRKNPAASRAGGSELFRGYRWLCPRCGRKVNLLFLPLPRVHLLGKMGKRTRRMLQAMNRNASQARNPKSECRINDRVGECLNDRTGTRALIRAFDHSDIDSPFGFRHSDFACERCHKIRRISRCDPNAWNEIVTYLSAGLLYGHEVKRPKWFPKARRRAILADQSPRLNAEQSEIVEPDETLLPDRTTGRKLPYTPRPTRAPSHRRPQIERMLLTGMSFKAIAAELGLVKGTVLWYAQQIYKHHNVRTLPEFLKNLGHPEHAEGLRGAHTAEVRRRLLAGESTREIATELNVPLYTVYNQRQQLRKQGVKLPDARHAQSRPVFSSSVSIITYGAPVGSNQAITRGWDRFVNIRRNF